MTTIVWRDWYSVSSLEQMERLGTVPREETDVNTRWLDSAEVAAAVACLVNSGDAESFRGGGKIVILEPAEFAGTFDITVDYEPSFCAYRSEE